MNTSGHSSDSQYFMFVLDFLKSYLKPCILLNSFSFLWIISVSIYYKIGFIMFMEFLATVYTGVNLILILLLIVVLIFSYIFHLTCKKLGVDLFKGIKFVRMSNRHQYKTSHDYAALWVLLQKTPVICILDCHDVRDVACTLFFGAKASVVGRGIRFSAKTQSSFMHQCEQAELEFIVPVEGRREDEKLSEYLGRI
jgi:hypothetical protein